MQTLDQLAQNLVPYLKPWFVSLQTTPVAVGARVYNSAALTLAHNTQAVLTFNAARYDTDGLWSASNPSRLTCTRAGVYAMSGHVVFAANAAGVRYVYLRLNGATDIASHGSSASSTFETVYSLATIYQLVEGDYIEMRAYQNSGGALNINAGPAGSPELAMHRLA